MSMTRQQLRNQIAYNHGNRNDKDAIINQILNFVVDAIGEVYDWDDLEDIDYTLSLAIADYSEPLGPTMRKVRFIRLKTAGDAWLDISKLDMMEFRRRYTQSIPTGSNAAPEACTIIGRKLYFNTKADVAYTIYADVIRYPTAMTEDDDFPSILGIDHVIECYGTAWLYLHLDEPESAKDWFMMADAMLKNKASEASIPFANVPRRAPGS